MVDQIKYQDQIVRLTQPTEEEIQEQIKKKQYYKEPEVKKRRKRQRDRYEHSEKGKETRKRYSQTIKGKEVRKKINDKKRKPKNIMVISESATREIIKGDDYWMEY